VAKAEDISLKVSRIASNVVGKPKSGEKCRIQLGENLTEGKIDMYFDDDNGVEHAYIWVDGTYHKLHICRPTTEVSQ
jgi:hypothetical protein